MREFGVADKCIVLDKQSGKDFECPGYRRLIDELISAGLAIRLKREGEANMAARRKAQQR